MMTLLQLEWWKPVPDWPEYECSNVGGLRRVKHFYGNRKTGRLSPGIGNHGYYHTYFSRDGKKKSLLVHRLVVMTFIGGIPEKMDVCHYDGCKTNNRVSNLRIDTRKSNLQDKVRHGKTNRGEQAWNHKLTKEMALDAKKMLKEGVSPYVIAEKLGVRASTIYLIKNGRNWAWLDSDLTSL